MLIDYETRAKNSNDFGCCTKVDPERIFFMSEEVNNFLNSLTREWKLIPENLLGSETTQNFICYARLSL